MLREKRHGVDASPVARQVRCSALRNRRRDAEAARRRGARAHRALRAVPFRPAHPGRLRRPRQRPAPRHHARHDAARSRSATRSPASSTRSARMRRRTSSARGRRCFPWIGCGKCRDCLAGDENLCARNRFRRRLDRRRLRQPRAGAGRKVSARLRSAAGRHGRDADVLGHHRLWRAEAPGRPAAPAQHPADRARRRRHDGPVARAGDVQAADLGRRPERKRARGRAEERRSGRLRSEGAGARPAHHEGNRRRLRQRRRLRRQRQVDGVCRLGAWRAAARSSSPA